MFERVHTNIVIRGQTFASVRDAAQAMGVTTGTVYKAMSAGTLDGVGLGQAWPASMPIRIRGAKYADARVAAAQFGVTAGAIYQALYRGEIDRIGLPRRVSRVGAKPFSIGGLTFPSMAVASCTLGFGRGYVSKAYQRNSEPMKQQVLAAALRLVAEKERREAALRLAAESERRAA